MALSDHPQIDKYSINSDQSAIAMQTVLNQQSGFVLRIDVPDKGCDFDAELILDGKSASNWRFGIQLKSAENIQRVSDGTMISYSFETSRLGYLIRRPYAGGLIVIFGVSSKTCYYDYADRIYYRLLNEWESEEWAEQDTVRIHIPVHQVLDHHSAISIHQEFLTRFQNGERMQRSQGAKYNLPTINLSGEKQWDIHNPEDVKEILRKHGYGLLNEMDMQLLYGLLSSLTSADIGQEKLLQIIAATVYSEIGKIPESELYISKLKKRSDLTVDEDRMVSFSRLKNELVTGLIDIKTFIQAAKALRSDEFYTKNALALDINIVFYELVSVKFYHETPPHIAPEVKKLFERISRSDLTTRYKSLLEIWNAENFAQLITLHRLHVLHEFALRTKFRLNSTSFERETRNLELLYLQSQFTNGLDQQFNQAVLNNDPLVQAHIMYLRARYVLAEEMDFYSFSDIIPKRPISETQFKNHIDLVLKAADVFTEHNVFNLAHDCLGKGRDLIFIGRNIHHFNDGYDLGRLEEIQAQQEQHWELDKYVMVMPMLIENIKLERKRNIEKPMFLVRDMDAEEINRMAGMLVSHLKNGEANRHELVRILNGYRQFYLRCQDENIELIQVPANNMIRRDDIFHTRFVLHNKITKVRSLPEYDISRLLTSWGL